MIANKALGFAIGVSLSKIREVGVWCLRTLKAKHCKGFCLSQINTPGCSNSWQHQVQMLRLTHYAKTLVVSFRPAPLSSLT